MKNAFFSSTNSMEYFSRYNISLCNKKNDWLGITIDLCCIADEYVMIVIYLNYCQQLQWIIIGKNVNHHIKRRKKKKSFFYTILLLLLDYHLIKFLNNCFVVYVIIIRIIIIFFVLLFSYNNHTYIHTQRHNGCFLFFFHVGFGVGNHYPSSPFIHTKSQNLTAVLFVV